MKETCKGQEEVDVEYNGEKIPLSPHVFEEIERYENVTIIVGKCRHCGYIDISWERQEDTLKHKM
jgi:hypothetical protein